MFDFDVYKDIAQRTNGDIYVGVVGPVRTGKSTFISRFMEELVIPNITGAQKSVAVDELPQSASGKTIMTTEPKFVPAKAATVELDHAVANVRLIDCVGYLVQGASGYEEENKPRLVKTPWSDEEMPFETASEIGTRKVITEHSTVGIVVTTDGSFTDISRENYEKAEERVISELKSIGKPFVIFYNTSEPTSKKAQAQKRELEEKYGVAVVCDNALSMDKSRLMEVLKCLLLEFPMRSFDIGLPKWLEALPPSNRLIASLIDQIKAKADKVTTMKSFSMIEDMFVDNETFEEPSDVSLELASGRAFLNIRAKNGVFFKVLSEECEENIDSELVLLNYVRELSDAKKNYAKLKGALECAESTGYGIVTPSFDETELTEPEVVKKTGGYAVRMKAKAKSLHIIRADVETDISPVYGSKKQCDDFVDYFKNSEEDVCWNTAVFGKPLHDIIGDEVAQSSSALGDNVKYKLRKTLTKAVDEKKSNLFCILI